MGEGAQRQFSGLEIGDHLNLNNQQWRIVGVFASGDTHASEVWTDAELLMAAYRRNGFQSVAARLTEPAAIEPLRAALAADPRLRVDVETTRAYYSKQSERLTKVIRGIGTGVAVIMALGAIFGALNTMYAAVANRAREIATLRALGFTGSAGRGGGDAGDHDAGRGRRHSGRRHRLGAVQRLYGLHPGVQFQPGRVPVSGDA